MRVLITGSAGHLGEGLARTLKDLNYEVVGIDILPSPFTTHQGSVTDRSFVSRCLDGVEVIFHTATLHKPHVATHSPQDFIDTNITGTLNLLQEATAKGIQRFIFTSTTSVFGDALIPPVGTPAAWVTEDVTPIPKNIYGVTKTSAEDLCQLFHRNHALACIILRTSRFFPEEDDHKEMRNAYADDNLKVNEYLFRRVDLEDAVSAHIVAADKALNIGFGKYIISATTPFSKQDLTRLRTDAPQILQQLFPDYKEQYDRRGWKMHPGIDRVYVNEQARTQLGWKPKYDFSYMLDLLRKDDDLQSPLTRLVGSKGYHTEKFSAGPYPVL